MLMGNESVSHSYEGSTRNVNNSEEKGSNKIKVLMLIVIFILTALVIVQGRKLASLKQQQHKNIDYQPKVQEKKEVSAEIEKQKEEQEAPVQPKTQPKMHRPVAKGMDIDIPLIDGIHLASEHHRNDDRTFTYPTVGIPIPGNKYNSTKVDPKDYDQFDTQVNNFFKTYNDTDCDYFRIGDEVNAVDGGYVLCRNFINQTEGIINIGVNGFDSFGCELATLNDMPNYQYDCTNDNDPVCTTNEAYNHFNLICLGEQTEVTPKHSFMSLEDMIKSNGLYKKRIFLKLDAEGGQYPGLKTFPVENLHYIDQIVTELHFGTLYREEWGMLDIFRTLSEHFVSVNYHMNNMGCQPGRKLRSNGIEATLVNKRHIKVKNPTRTFALHPLNKENAYWVASCNIEEE